MSKVKTIKKSKGYSRFVYKFGIDIQFEKKGEFLKKSIVSPPSNWNKIQPNLEVKSKNFGILCGDKNGIIVVDIDIPKTISEVSGIEQFESNVCKLSELNTLVTSSPSGGYHVYFNYNSLFKKRNIKFNLFDKVIPIDILTNGSFVLEGNNYVLIHDNDICDPPESFISWINELNETQDIYNKNKDIISGDVQQLQQKITTILNSLDKVYVDTYDYWFKILYILKKSKVDVTIAKEWSKKSEKYSEESFTKTWTNIDTNQYPTLRIFTLLYYFKQSNGSAYNTWVKKSLHDFQKTFVKDLTTQDTNDYTSITEDRAWIKFEEYYPNLLLTTDNGSYILNEYGIWEESNTNRAKKRINDLLVEFHYKLNEESLSFCLTNSKCRNSFKPDLFTYFYRNIKFDQKTNLLAFNNGVYDIETHQFRNAEPEEYVYTTTNYDYCECNSNDSYLFIKDIFPDSEILELFLKKLAGALFCTGIGNEFFFGYNICGANAKSTLLSLIQCAFGNYCISPSSDFLLKTNQTNSEGANPMLHSLKDKRVVMFSEIKDGSKLDSNFLKRLTGRDMQTARDLYRSPESFRVNAMFIIVSNKEPEFDKTDPALIRRQRNIPFEAHFTSNPDPNNKFEKMVKQNINIQDLRDSFIQLLIEKYTTLIPMTLEEMPIRIQKMVEEYTRSADDLHRFCADHLIESSNSILTKNQLKNAFDTNKSYREYDLSAYRNCNQFCKGIEVILKTQFKKIRQGSTTVLAIKGWKYINSETDETIFETEDV